MPKQGRQGRNAEARNAEARTRQGKDVLRQTLKAGSLNAEARVRRRRKDTPKRRCRGRDAEARACRSEYVRNAEARKRRG